MQNFWLTLLIALQFLTKIPITLSALPTARQNALALLWYPWVGLLIGGVLWLIACVSTLPIMVLSALIVLAWVWLTGGLHLDGLADTADGFVGGYGDKTRTLAIMKDPTCGAMGIMAIVLCLMLKWSSVYALLAMQQPWLLLLVPVFGRLAILGLFLTTPYVRAHGLGASLANFLPKVWAWVMLIVGLLGGGIAVLLGSSPIKAIRLLGIFVITLAYLRYIFCQKINGITGDTVGASVEIIEITILLAYLA